MLLLLFFLLLVGSWKDYGAFLTVFEFETVRAWCCGSGASDAASGNQPRMIGVTTLVAGFFWGMMRSLVLTSMHFQMLGPGFLIFMGFDETWWNCQQVSIRKCVVSCLFSLHQFWDACRTMKLGDSEGTPQRTIFTEGGLEPMPRMFQSFFNL